MRVASGRLIHRDAAHEDELDWRGGLRCYDRSAEPPRGLRDQVARRAEDPLEAENVTETRDDGVAAANIAQEILVAQRQQIGRYYFEWGSCAAPFGSRSADRTMALTLMSQLRSCSRTRPPVRPVPPTSSTVCFVFISLPPVKSARPSAD